MNKTMRASEISPEQAKAKMEQGATVADVRDPGEFEEGHIAGAILLPAADIKYEAAARLPDRDAEILVYCQSGQRSRRAAAQLRFMGYTAVYDLGAITEWPYELEY